MQETHADIPMLLARIPPFSSLDDKGLVRAARGATEIEPEPGTTLFARGDACDGMFVVVSGRVKLALPSAESGEKVLALIGAGESFDESALFLNQTHLVSAETLGHSKLIHITKAAVLACMKRDPEFAKDVVLLLSRRTHQLLREIENAATHTGTQRVLDFLIDELPGEALDGAATIALPAKKRVIASRLDLTHEHFSRILHDLSAARLLVVEGARVTIPDVKRLLAYRSGSAAP